MYEIFIHEEDIIKNVLVPMEQFSDVKKQETKRLLQI